MSNGMDPARMAAGKRLDELGMLLSLAMLRLWRKQHAGPGQQRAVSREFAEAGEDCLALSDQTSPDRAV